MTDEIAVHMIVSMFSTETGAETALAALRPMYGPGYLGGVSNAVVLRKDLLGGLQMENRPDLTSNERAGSDGMVDAVIELMVGPTGSLMPGTSALITMGDESAAAEVRRRLPDQRAFLVEAIQVNLTARPIFLDHGDKFAASRGSEV
jgi:hypothetical protein